MALPLLQDGGFGVCMLRFQPILVPGLRDLRLTSTGFRVLKCVVGCGFGHFLCSGSELEIIENCCRKLKILVQNSSLEFCLLYFWASGFCLPWFEFADPNVPQIPLPSAGHLKIYRYISFHWLTCEIPPFSHKYRLNVCVGKYHAQGFAEHLTICTSMSQPGVIVKKSLRNHPTKIQFPAQEI